MSIIEKFLANQRPMTPQERDALDEFVQAELSEARDSCVTAARSQCIVVKDLVFASSSEDCAKQIAPRRAFNPATSKG